MSESPIKCRFIKRGQKPCKNNAKRDGYCKAHWDLMSRKQHQRLARTLPMFYSKYLNKTLEDAVKEQLDRDHNEQLSLVEELALMRCTVADALKLYTACDKIEDEEKQNATRTSAGIVLQEALNEVKGMCTAAASVEASRKDSISPLQLKAILLQVTTLFYQICGEDNEHLARELERRLSEEIRLPSDPTGTDLDPTQDVQEMIDSIPKN